MILIAQWETKSISITSPSLPHLKKGARKDTLDILKDFEIYDDRDFNMTDQIYSFPQSGSYIEFFGVEDSAKVRGPGRDILYENEANLIPYATHTQLALRTREVIFMDFNPADEFSWVYEVSDKPENKLIVSNYLNNLSNLTKAQIAEIEGLKLADPNLYKVFGLGLRGTSSETIYTHWKLCKDLPLKGERFYGQDFGYNVQSALVEAEIYEGAIYAKQLLYETKLTTNDLLERYKTLGIFKKSEIFCDAAEPKTIEEITRAGYNAKPADKDVTEGIRKVKSMPLYITEDSTDLIKEIRNYKWKIDKNEKVLDEPVKFADHLCFVGETKITCDTGLKLIKDIQPGDNVLTTFGFKKVLKRFDNGVQQTVEYSMLCGTHFVTLRCTPNHLIKTNLGWIPISKLEPGMTIFLSKPLTGKHTSYTERSDILPKAGTECISEFGNISKAKSRRAFTFITKMKTGLITGLKTLSLSLAKIICPSTFASGLKTIQNGLKHFMIKVLQQHLNGISLMLEYGGIQSMPQSTILVNSTLEKRTVKYVKENLWQEREQPNSVIKTAELKHLDAEEKLPEYVYDLEVEDAHEYFANGVLCHNCDALRYAIWTKLTTPQYTVWTI